MSLAVRESELSVLLSAGGINRELLRLEAKSSSSFLRFSDWPTKKSGLRPAANPEPYYS